MNKLYKFSKGKRIKSLKDISCANCLLEFSPKTSKDKYCSRNCYYEMKRIRKDRVEWTLEMRIKMSEKYKGKGNPMYGRENIYKDKKRPDMTAEKHPNWKGGYWISKEGYKVFENSKDTLGKKVAEHRMIIEKSIGRKLSSNEIIHHKNEDKLDNRIENLQIMTRAEHMIHHLHCKTH